MAILATNFSCPLRYIFALPPEKLQKYQNVIVTGLRAEACARVPDRKRQKLAKQPISGVFLSYQKAVEGKPNVPPFSSIQPLSSERREERPAAAEPTARRALPARLSAPRLRAALGASLASYPRSGATAAAARRSPAPTG